MLQKIKSRLAKVSHRGIYIQDNELKDTSFVPGEHFKYVIDIKHKRLVILPTEHETSNKVSKRCTKDGLKPVLDIRSAQALECFRDCAYLQVTIYEDKVKIEGFENGSNDFFDTQEVFNSKQVTCITEILNVNKKAEVILSKDSLQKAAGMESIPLIFVTDCETSNRKIVSKVMSFGNSLERLLLPLSFSSLCCGAGVLDLGFIKSGFDSVFALDLDKYACETYRANVDPKVICGDMLDLDEIPNAPVVLAGTKCQGFSSSNRRNNYSEREGSFTDPLIEKLLKLVSSNKAAKVLVYENVPQMLTCSNNKYLELFKSYFPDADISFDILPSAGFGSSQIRKRAIIIVSRIGKIELPKPYLQPSEYKTVREAFEGLSDDIPNQLDYTIPLKETIEKMQCVPQGGNVYDIPVDIRPHSKHSCSYMRLRWDMCSKTLASVRKAVILHPEYNRILSIREVARTLGINDDFVFKGSISAMQQQAANCVSFNLAKALGDVVRKAIDGFNRNIKRNMDEYNTVQFVHS